MHKHITMNNLEKRMYFFVPYNISPIQQAIQAGHAMGEYALKYGRYDSDHLIWDFLEKWKTWIVLNGGTTNFKIIEVKGKNQASGTLNQIQESLTDNDIEYSTFIEPDLNDALTAICLIVDERVFNYKDYPDWNGSKWWNKNTKIEPFYSNWIEKIGGKKNLFLRDLLKYKKLA